MFDLPNRNGIWKYTHSDGKAYLCEVVVIHDSCEITWLTHLPQGDWVEGGWQFVRERTQEAEGRTP